MDAFERNWFYLFEQQFGNRWLLFASDVPLNWLGVLIVKAVGITQSITE